jgi:hypothetical protein
MSAYKPLSESAKAQRERLAVRWVRFNPTAWLCKKLRGAAAPAPLGPRSEEIERLAADTNELGPQPLWSGYGEHSAGRQVRAPNVVRTK